MSRDESARRRISATKKKEFCRGLAQGKEAMRRMRESALVRVFTEKETRYVKEDFNTFRELSPLFKLHFIPRLGHLAQTIGSYKKAALLIDIDQKLKFANRTGALCDDELLFCEGRQWCYSPIKKLMKTGLFSSRHDAQKMLSELEYDGLLYVKDKRKKKSGADASNWYSIEYLHPIFIFLRKELLNVPIGELKLASKNLSKSLEARKEHKERIMAEFKRTGQRPEEDDEDDIE